MRRGMRVCSEDAYTVLECDGDDYVPAEECMIDHGRLCLDGACVDPWQYAAPDVDDCAGDPHATAMNLAEKAAKYDEIVPRLHVHPDDKRAHDVRIAPETTEADATWEDVVDWRTGENDGLWTGLYIASQAFRYAATQSPEALANLRVMMDGMDLGMRITGVPGVFTREYITPGVDGMSCPANTDAYIPDVEKDDNRWVKIDDEGYVVVWDPNLGDWSQTTHSVGTEFADYCWLDNVSKDEYAGHMFALHAVYKLVDDPDVRAMAASLLERVGDHLFTHDMAFTDWDGRLTEHGRMWPTALDDFPGFNASMGLGYMKAAVLASGREDLRDYYDDCLLQKSGPNNCIDRFLSVPVSYAEWLRWPGLYVGRDGCKSNWNNISMMFLSYAGLIWYEHEYPEIRELAQRVFEDQMFRHNDNEREVAKQHNAAWAMLYAAMRDTRSGQDNAAIQDAICTLQQFPETQAQVARDFGEDAYPTDTSCESRFDGYYLTFDPVPVYERCAGTFTWWSNPYSHQICDEDLTSIKRPADFLLPYWMGRYFGFIDAGW
ncbi:MAG: hypothetical protein M5R36_18205 [Deltaproteobacteria bacterium]|nr:hypothetical protein [Deltaproteobacteria bacterium]